MTSLNRKQQKVEVVRTDAGNEQVGKPEWIRLPRSGQRCPHTGVSRSAMNELILGDSPAVESLVLRKSGKIRGVRLVRLEALLRFLDGIAQEQREAAEEQ